MKKIIITLISCFVGLLASFVFAQPHLTANAVDENEDIIVSVFDEQLTESAAEYYINEYHQMYYSNNLDSLSAGDVRIGLRITNNTGYTTFACYLEYDADNYEIYKMPAPSENLIYTLGPAGLGLSYLVTPANPNGTHPNRISISSSGSSDNTQDGEMIYFFLKLKPNANPNPSNQIVDGQVAMLCDSDATVYIDTDDHYTLEPEQEYQTIIFYYMLGDINGDCEVDTVDSSILQQVLAYKQNNNVTIEQAFAHYSSTTGGMWTPENILVLDVADANLNGSITSADATAIQSYYQLILLEEPYTGPIGEMYCFTMLVPITTP